MYDESITQRRNIRVSSRTEEYDPDRLSKKLVKNKINHLQFRPELFNYESVRHIKSVLQQESPRAPSP